MKEDLNPCPKCKGNMLFFSTTVPKSTDHYVKCLLCRFKVSAKTKKEAMSLWNQK